MLSLNRCKLNRLDRIAARQFNLINKRQFQTMDRATWRCTRLEGGWWRPDDLCRPTFTDVDVGAEIKGLKNKAPVAKIIMKIRPTTFKTGE